MIKTGEKLELDRAINWLLEKDADYPAIRYLTLKDVVGTPENEKDLQAARAAIMQSGIVPAILDKQNPDGSWTMNSGIYQRTDIQLVLLAEMAADEDDARVQRACRFVLEHDIAANGAFAERLPAVPSEAYPCKNGFMIHALIQLGCAEDERVRRALDWQAQAVTGDWKPGGRYYKSAACAAGFSCGENSGLPCGWGAVKVVRAFQALQPDERTPQMQAALQDGVDFLLRYDIAQADYPHQGKISSTWFKLGFPLTYWSDILELCDVLAGQGYGQDSRLQPAIQRVLDQRDPSGRWIMNHSLNGKMWVDIEDRGKPSKSVTLRVLRMLKKAGWVD